MDRRQMLGATLAVLPGSAAARNAEPLQFSSGGVAIGAEWFPAARLRAGETAPALLLLHGADGMTQADRYRLAAGLVSASGFHVALVRYLDRTGERRVSYGTLRERYPLWAAAIRDGLDWLATRPGVDPSRLGLVGVSLGAALALSAAAADGRVRAIVDFSGPIPEDLANGFPHLPPTLILHGEADRIVPVSHARDLARLLNQAGTDHELQIYPGQGHVLTGAAQMDAASRVSAFLNRHLRRS